MSDVFIHESAVIGADAVIGGGSKIWAFSQVREGARIGRDCILGHGCYVGEGVTIGNRVKLENGVYVFAGATVEDGVFLGPRAMLLNDLVPRAITPTGELKGPEDWQIGRTTIRKGASLGAGTIVLPGLQIGTFAMSGAGSVVTRDVPPFALVHGNPARLRGWLCACGNKVSSREEPPARSQCPKCDSQVKAGLS